MVRSIMAQAELWVRAALGRRRPRRHEVRRRPSAAREPRELGLGGAAEARSAEEPPGRRHGREVRCRREESTALGRAGPNPRTTWARPRLRRLQTKRPPTSEAADHPPFSLSLSLSLSFLNSFSGTSQTKRKDDVDRSDFPPEFRNDPWSDEK